MKIVVGWFCWRVIKVMGIYVKGVIICRNWKIGLRVLFSKGWVFIKIFVLMLIMVVRE